jgi:hypothetical protein
MSMAAEHRDFDDSKRDVEPTEFTDEKKHDQSPSSAPRDPQLEKKLVRKLDSVIMPLTCALYLFAYLDRSNLGYSPSFLSSVRFLTGNLQGMPDFKVCLETNWAETQQELNSTGSRPCSTFRTFSHRCPQLSSQNFIALVSGSG